MYEGTPSQANPVVWDWDRGNNVGAHVAVYEHLVGAVPDGQGLYRLCRTRGCVRPDHFDATTRADHSRSHKTVRSHCVHGHELSAANTHLRADGQRICRECARAAVRRWAARQRIRRGW